MIKKSVWLLSLIFFCLIIVSCMKITLVPEGTESKMESPKQGTPITTLEFWHTYSDIETEIFEKKVLPLFHSQFPQIKIKAIRKDYTDQLKNNVFASIADNKQPDIMRMDIIWVPEFAKNGALEELSELEGFTEIRDKFIGALIQTNLYKGEYYGLPINANTRAAIFNKTLLKEAGLEEPPATFKELIEATERLQQKKPDIYGIGICCSNGWGMLPYFWTFGGELMNPKYTQASGYLNSDSSKAALGKIKQWFDKGIISPSIIGGEPGTWDGILKGNLLMIDDAHWFYTVNSSGPYAELLDDTVLGLIPNDAQMGTSVIGGENLVLFKGSQHKEAAWQFIKWMTKEEPQQLMAETGLIPTIKNLQQSNQNPLFTPYLEQLDRALPRPPVPAWTEIENVFARMVERIISDEQPISEAMDEAAMIIDGLLANE